MQYSSTLIQVTEIQCNVFLFNQPFYKSQTSDFCGFTLFKLISEFFTFLDTASVWYLVTFIALSLS